MARTSDEFIELITPVESSLGPALPAEVPFAGESELRENSTDTPLLPHGRPTILLVDDEPLNLEFMKDIFEDSYRVITSESGTDALANANTCKPDLILLDVMMPGIDGYEVCRLLKHNPETRDIPVVFVTGVGHHMAELRGLELGAADFVHKPIETALVKARVSNLITLRRTQKALINVTEERQAEKLALLTQRFTEKTELNGKLAKALAEKEVLLKEVHHRVKNNLQVICSMLGMQATVLQDTTAIAALQNSQSRVRSMAIMHEMFYGSNTLSEVDFSAYAGRLMRELAETYGIDSSRLRLLAEATPQLLDINHAIPCGMIVNELVTNSLKYALSKDLGGEVVVSFRPSEPGTMRLTVEDNGIGLPRGFEIGKTRSLGLRIVQILVKQLGGSLRVASSEGTKFAVTFPFAIRA